MNTWQSFLETALNLLVSIVPWGVREGTIPSSSALNAVLSPPTTAAENSVMILSKESPKSPGSSPSIVLMISNYKTGKLY